MGMTRQDSKLRYRKLTLAAGGEAEVWIDASTGRAAYHTRQQTDAGGGEGTAYWEKCSHPGCAGERVLGEACLRHASDSTRVTYLQAVVQAGASVGMKGVEIDEPLWTSVLAALTDDDAVIATPISCLGASLSFRPKLCELVFTGHVEFSGAVLEEGIEATDCTFGAGLRLGFADLGRSPSVFQRCSVTSETYADCAFAEQHLAFMSCEFHGDVSAKGFVGDIRFDDSQLHRSLALDFAALKHLSLSESVVHRQLTMDRTAAGWINARGAHFLGATVIGELTTDSGFSLEGARFDSRVQLALTGNLDLKGATFRAGGRFSVDEATINLERVILGDPLVVVGKGSAEVLSIQAADAGLLSFASVKMSRCVFYGAHNLQAISLEPSVELASAPRPLRARRRCIADECAWRARHSLLRRKDWVIPGTWLEPVRPEVEPQPNIGFPNLGADQVGTTYRALRASFENRADQGGADDFYFGEMEMRRRSEHSSRAERGLIWAYWLVSGYGLRAWRSLIFLLTLWLSGTILFEHVGFDKPAGIKGGALASAQSIVPGVSVSGALTQSGRAIDLVLTVLGPVFIALALLAVRNRIKR